MKNYTGVDIIETDRIAAAVARFGEHFLNRVYTPDELATCRGRPEALAARFACKEAVMKLLGTGWGRTGWRDVETLSNPEGRPVVTLHGNAREAAARLGIHDIAVSLSHSRRYAVATAVSTGAA